MEINQNTAEDGHPVLALVGRFDAFETEAFRGIVNELLVSPTNTITIDLSEVQFIDSSALAELVRGMKRCRQAKGEFFLHQLSDPVRVILELTRLDAAFEITGD